MSVCIYLCIFVIYLRVYLLVPVYVCVHVYSTHTHTHTHTHTTITVLCYTIRVCGSEVTPGTVWRSSSSTLILYFRGEAGGFRGFRLSVNFASIPGCCQSHSNNTSSPTFYLHSPSYPALSTAPFNCSYSLPTVSQCFTPILSFSFSFSTLRTVAANMFYGLASCLLFGVDLNFLYYIYILNLEYFVHICS